MFNIADFNHGTSVNLHCMQALRQIVQVRKETIIQTTRVAALIGLVVIKPHVYIVAASALQSYPLLGGLHTLSVVQKTLWVQIELLCATPLQSPQVTHTSTYTPTPTFERKMSIRQRLYG